MESIAWYYAKQGVKHGPIADHEIRQLAAAGVLEKDDLVWTWSLGKWRPAGEVPGLFPATPVCETPTPGSEPAPQNPYTFGTTEGVHISEAKTPEPFTVCAGLSQPPRNSRSFFSRHWHGELSLAVSYWVNTVSLSLLLPLLILPVIRAIDVTKSPTFYSVLVISIWIAVASVAIWQFVGLWRSAQARTRSGHSGFWPGFAKVMVVLGMLNLAITLGTQGVPQIEEYLKIAAGDKEMSDHKVRVLRQGTELEVSGSIGFGLTDEVRKHLDANPNITVIHLNSRGGRVAEGTKLGELIGERRLTTYTSVGCASACVLAFLGGKNRYIHKDAALGFHAPSMPGVNREDLAEEIRQETSLYTAAGVRQNFTQHVFEVPSDSIWQPSAQELLAANVVTAIAGPGDFAMSQVPASVEKPMEEFLKVPVYAAIHDYDPKSYALMEEEAASLLRQGVSEAEFVDRLRPIVAHSYERFLPLASDEVMGKACELLVFQLEDLASEGPQYCHAMLFPNEAPTVKFVDHLSPESKRREMALMPEVIRTGATNPADIPTQVQAEPIITAFMMEFGKKHPRYVPVLANPDDPSVDQATVCTVFTDFYREALLRPSVERAAILRYILTNSDKR